MNEQERRARIRNSIREFYELSESPARAAKAPPGVGGDAPAIVTPTENSDMELDSEAFNVQKFTLKLLREQSLKGLYETDTSLRRQVRELDGDLQTLVYDNYSKFISATDTIRHMRQNVDDMDTKLKALSSNVEHIDTVSSTISSNMQAHRQKIEEMLAMNSMLRKIKFLVELPGTLTRLVAQKKYATAVKRWIIGDAVLRKYASIPSFERTHRDCREIAKRLREQLKAFIAHTSLEGTNADSVREAVENMRQLQATSVAAAGDADFEEEVLNLLMTQLRKDFAIGAKSISDNLDTDSKKKVSSASERYLRDAGEFPRLEIKTYSNALRALCDTLKGQTERSLDIVGKLTTQSLASSVVADALPVMLNSVDLVMEKTSSTTLQILGGTIKALAAAESNTTKSTFGLILDAYLDELREFAVSFNILGKECLKSAPTQLASFTDSINKSIRKSVMDVLAFCENSGKNDNVLAKTVTEQRTAMREIILTAALAKAIVRHKLLEAVGNEISNVDLVPLRSAFVEIHQRLACTFLGIVGQRTTQLLRDALDEEDWLQKKEPVAVSPCMIRFVTELDEWAQYLSNYFTQEKSTDARSAGSVLSRNSSDRTGGNKSIPTVANYLRREAHSLVSDVDRVFKGDGATHMKPRTIDVPHLMEACISYTLKSLVEFVRVRTFSKGGFQQVQVDSSFLLASLELHPKWYKREERIVTLIDEFVTCSYERCTDRIPLPAAQVEQIAKSEQPKN